MFQTHAAPPSSEPTAVTGGLADGPVAGIAVGALVVVAIGVFTAGLIYYNSRKRRESKGTPHACNRTHPVLC